MNHLREIKRILTPLQRNPSAKPIGSFGDYEHKTFAVPASVKREAELGLSLRERFGTAQYRDRTEVGTLRAKQLARGTPAVTLRDIVFMRAWFRRHAVDIRNKKLDRERPTNGWMSWLLWGGNAGRDWAESIAKKHGL